MMKREKEGDCYNHQGGRGGREVKEEEKEKNRGGN